MAVTCQKLPELCCGKLTCKGISAVGYADAAFVCIRPGPTCCLSKKGAELYSKKNILARLFLLKDHNGYF